MVSLKEQLKMQRSEIVWLASYPKSGNTWFRCFLSALIEGEVNINRLHTDGIFSSRHIFDTAFDIDGRMLDEQEIKNLMPRAVRYYASQSKKMLFCKIHDAYSYNSRGQAIIPSEVTWKVIYLIRNPLDVVASFANHNNSTVDAAIALMNNPRGYLARQKNGFNVNNQTPQLMYSWSGHVQSWHEQEELDILTVRYEDMKQNALKTFSEAAAFIGLEVDDEAIENAIALSEFEKLKETEEAQGFREKNIKSPSFFRKGQTGGYKEELTPEQIRAICIVHGKTMKEFGYDVPL